MNFDTLIILQKIAIGSTNPHPFQVYAKCKLQKTV